jgi:hypothetical protein
MLDCYKEVCRRMKGQDVIIRLARKLLRRMRAVLLSGNRYVMGINGAVIAKDIAAPLPPALKKRGRPKKVVPAAFQ